MEGAVTALLCRPADRAASTAEGARELAVAVAERLDVTPRFIGTPAPAAAGRYDDDVREGRGCLLEAGGQVQDALDGERFPVLTSADCAISVTTLPAVGELRPDALVLWLDAHGDFNDPDSAPDGPLRAMSLAGACGVWDPGLDQPGLDPSRVVMCGVRDVEARERILLERHGVGLVERPSRLAPLLDGRRVYVHLDLDVLDPRVMPGVQRPAEGGFSDGGLRTLLAEVAEAAEVVGVEIAGLPDPALARRVATIVEPLLP